MTKPEPRFVKMHDDHIWDNTTGFYVGVAMDEDETDALVSTLNASDFPSLSLQIMRDRQQIWGCTE